MSFSDEEYQEFKTEAIELLDQAEETLLNITENSDFKSCYETIFRSFHNLKGAAGMMEVTNLQAHTHEVETIFTEFKSAQGMSQNEIDFFLKAIDGARLLLDGGEIEFDYSIPKGDEPQAQAEPEIEKSEQKTEEKSDEALKFNDEGTYNFATSEFVTESKEMLEKMFDSLLNLEKDASRTDEVTEIYRQAHSLKGGAGLFGMSDIGAIAHHLESFLDEMRDVEGSVTQKNIDDIYSSLKKIEALLNPSDSTTSEASSEEGQDVAPSNGESSFTENSPQETADSTEVQTLQAESVTKEQEDIENSHQSHQDAIEHANEVIDSISEMHQLQPETSTSDSSVEPKASEAQTPPPQASSPVELVEVQKETDSTPSQMDTPVPIEASVASQKSTPAKEAESANASVRVSVRLLDKLMTLMGEMVLVRNQMIQYTNNSDDMDFHNLSKRLSVVTSEIQEQMMKTRMQPIGNVVNKFQRVVRDLSKSLDKDIELIIEGAETELDKSLLEAIKDPLTHIVRNSCDHGIETREQRKVSKKSMKGKIYIKAFHEGGQVVIEIQDDGRGLNKQAIIKKAIERNLLSMSQIDQMTDSEIYNLIFSSGFSTAQKVTNVSGRGVGMDVVATNIESIGGTVEIKSSPGQGTSFFLKIPLTLAIVPALIVTCGENRIAIPQVKLHELVRVDQSSSQKIEMIQGTPVFRLRGNILPLIDLRRVLVDDQDDDRDFNAEEVVNIAVIQAEGQLIGLIVDKIMDTADIVVKPLNKMLKSLQAYSGATVLGDGSVALILDIQGIRKMMNIASVKNTKNAHSESDSHNSYLDSYDRQDFLLVSLDSETKHAILLNFVHRLEEFSRSQVEMSGHAHVVRYRGEILSLISCSKEFQYSEKENFDRDSFPVIVVERAGRMYGLVVNEIIDTLQTSNEVQFAVEKRKGIVGNLNMDDELVVVIDPFDLIEGKFPNAVESKIAINKNPEKDIGKIATENGQLNILLVEDTPFFRKVIQKSLEQQGHTVDFAINGLDAYELLESKDRAYDLIISDIEMPKMNGFEFAEKVRLNETHKETPMLALSSRFDEKYQNRGYEAGFNCYMEKFKPDVLNRKIGEMTGREAA